MNAVRQLLFVCALYGTLLAAACSDAQSPAHRSTTWQPYDEAAELAALAAQPAPELHFRQLNSLLRDRNDLWSGFAAELDAFGAARYQRLQPLILEASVQSLQQAVASGELDYETLTLFYLYRIRDIESDRSRYLNAVIATNPRALEQARAADLARSSGAVNPAPDSLFGLPVLLKDNIGAAGMPTTAGAAVLADNYSDDAFITQRLLASGAVILGKTNLSEWAYFFCDDCPSGWSAVGGQTLNPYGRFVFGTGGSSSGSAAAVAANLAVVTVGSETSGSILSPASRHSAVGFKPTTGRLSRSGVIPISATLDTTGPITRTVRDAISLFNALQGFDPADPKMDPAHDGPLGFTAQPLPGQRLGYFQAWLEEPLYAGAIAQLEAAGASMVALDLPGVVLDGFDRFLGMEMRRDLPAYLQASASSGAAPAGIEDIVAFNNSNAAVYAPYGQALFDMMLELPAPGGSSDASPGATLQRSATAVLGGLYATHALDALVSLNNRSAALAALANHPALTLPLGLDADGAPLGLTLIMPGWQEQALAGLALSVESLVGKRTPPLGY